MPDERIVNVNSAILQTHCEKKIKEPYSLFFILDQISLHAFFLSFLPFLYIYIYLKGINIHLHCCSKEEPFIIHKNACTYTEYVDNGAKCNFNDEVVMKCERG